MMIDAYLIIILLQWANLCGSYLVEARWFSGGHKPTLNEYLENAWTSVAGPAAIVHACLLPPKECKLSKHSLINCLKDGYEVIYWSSQITRLSNDLGTTKVTTLIRYIHTYIPTYIHTYTQIYIYICMYVYFETRNMLN